MGGCSFSVSTITHLTSGFKKFKKGNDDLQVLTVK